MKRPVWFDVRDAIAIHAEQVAEYGGNDGIRDQNLLESALNRPLPLQSYGDPSVFDLAASYACDIARNHPFVDGNKRTALVLSFAFLESNGWEVKPSEEQAAITFFEVASGTIDERTLARWFSQNSVRMPRPANTVDRKK